MIISIIMKLCNEIARLYCALLLSDLSVDVKLLHVVK